MMNIATTGSGIKKLSDFFSLLEFPFTEIDTYADAYSQLRSGRINGIMINNVLEENTLAEIVNRLEKNEPDFLKTWFPEEFKSWFYGRNLNLSHPDLVGYFDEARLFNRQLDELDADGKGLSKHVTDILSRVDGGRKFITAPGMDKDDKYMFATIRCHLEGGFIPPHIDYEYMRRRSYSHLRTLVDAHITSYVLAFSSPDSGGTLDIYDNRAVSAEVSDPAQISQDFDINETESISIRIAPGAIFIFDSGRYLHAVSPITCKQKRWTACSFMALSQDKNSMYCWG